MGVNTGSDDTENEVMTDGPKGAGSASTELGGAVPSRSPASPYSTGGGGVTLERRVGALYLATLLTGDTLPELGDDRSILSIRFQQAPRVPIDDLVIAAGRSDETAPSVELAIGVRRRPNFVPSDSDTQGLVVEYVRGLINVPDDGKEHRLGLAVAGRHTHTDQLAQLTAVARTQMDAASFFDLLEEDGRFAKALRDRLGYLVSMVKSALETLAVPDMDETLAREMTWKLLNRLYVIAPNVEEPDTSDWAAALSRLVAVARGGDLPRASGLLDRLESLAGQYGPSAATVDRSLLRRDVHSLLDVGRWRSGRAWELLDHLQRGARVRDRLGSHGTEAASFHLDRSAIGQKIITVATSTAALVVSGESGVGKSALVMDAANAAAADSDHTEVVCVNLRQLPERSFDLVARLGCSVEQLLSELAAPRRLLVIDTADAAAEGWGDMFGYLCDAAIATDVGLIAVTSNEARHVVCDLIAARHNGQPPETVSVPALTDPELEDIAGRFTVLAGLINDSRSRELLRRLVVIDLLVRSGMSDIPLSDVDALNQVWSGLVRRHGQTDRGLPDARDQTLMQLARRELTQGDAAELIRKLDASAVDGLRRDGLLRTADDNPWQIVPEFAHDEIRRYALARSLLVNGDPATTVLEVGAPRWALSAARLACQTTLAQPDTTANPIRGRLARTQSAYDGLVAAGHGARWADIPCEALLTLGDPAAVLADAWLELSDGEAVGLRRLLRIIEQRHSHGVGLEPVVVEPVVTILLDYETPWRVSDQAAKVLRDWLRGLISRNASEGHQLRSLLRERLLAFCERAEAAYKAQKEEQANAHLQQSQGAGGASLAFRAGALGNGRPPRRERELPREVTEDTVLELLALLGPDLGTDGEALLRRVAQDTPRDLEPTVESLLTGRSLASYGHGLLADLVEAYYLDEDDDRSGLLDDGIRDHDPSSVGWGVPLAAWYRGPFMALFQTDFRRGVAVLNRLLNHAARIRIRRVASIADPWAHLTDEEIDSLSVQLQITGTDSLYVGDQHVWQWYRGTGVGPYPCMSALQALERVLDQYIAMGIPADPIVPILLDGCANLAMPALVVGLLVRHIESTGSLLDPFLAESIVWELEFGRAVQESAGLAASSDGLAAPERRTWSCREAASWLALHADPQRENELRAIGVALVSRARQLVEAAAKADEDFETGEQQPATGADSESPSFVTLVQGWASTLDRSGYRAYEENGQLYVQSTLPGELEESLKADNEDLQRGNEVLRIQWRYFAGGRRARHKSPLPTGQDLVDDLASAEALFANPPQMSAVSVWEMAAAIAAHTVEAIVLQGEQLPSTAQAFAVNVLLEIAEQLPAAGPFDHYDGFFEQGADRLAARAVPLLLLSAAGELRSLVAEHEGRSEQTRIADAAYSFAKAIANETRVELAQGLDAVWDAPCSTDGPCHHRLALELAVESSRDCVLGGWDQETQRLPSEPLSDPIVESLDAVPDGDLLVGRLDPALRALGIAATRPSCVTDRARELLAHLLQAQRRGLLADDRDFDQRGTHTLHAARALLNLADSGNDVPLHEAIGAYADNSARLAGLLRGITGAAEETQSRADAAGRIWPAIVDQVLRLHAEGHETFNERYYGTRALTALIPTPVPDIEFLYREVETEPITWADPLAWSDPIDAWIDLSVGDPDCVDALVGLLRTLPLADQIAFGLPRASTLVRADVKAVVRRSFLLSSWLIEIREIAVAGAARPIWQRLVDELVVAGDRTLAPYSD
jgi:hypothetical protein